MKLDKMFKSIKTIKQEKQEYKEYTNRVNKLPNDYKIVFQEISNYLYANTTGDGYDVLAILKELLDFFEDNASYNNNIIDVVGDDIVGFADELLTNTNSRKDKLNKKILNKLEKRDI